MQIALIDSEESRAHLLPLCFLKPISELRIGILTIREKWEKYFSQELLTISADYLEAKFKKAKGGGFWVQSNLLPTQELKEAILSLKPGECLIQKDIILAGHVEDYASVGKASQQIEFQGKVDHVTAPWDFFRKNGEQIRADYQLITKDRQSEALSDPHTIVYGQDIFIEEGVSIKAAVLNAENGPIYLGKNATIHEGALIKGPFAICEGSHVNMGAKIRGDATVGPFSKVGGEYSNSLIMGYSNKSHDGFLGNSVIGEWCNIGAASDSSNLKNNYRNVQVWSHATNRYEDTGLQFCGLIMGDHSRCSINTMFNTGTVVGVSAGLFGTDFHKKFVPSFSWGGREKYSTYRPEKAFETMEMVMQRRDKTLDESDKQILQHVFEVTAKNRTWEKK